MQGNCRKKGWMGYHGLTIEVQKRLDLMSNEAIEVFGMRNSTRNVGHLSGLMKLHGEK